MAGDEPAQAGDDTIARVGTYAVELQDVFDRILTLSTAAIAVIATFAQKFSGGTVWMGATSLIAFVVTIVSCLSVRAAVATWRLAYVDTDRPPVSPRYSLAERQRLELGSRGRRDQGGMPGGSSGCAPDPCGQDGSALR